jgi:hypothetical protein
MNNRGFGLTLTALLIVASLAVGAYFGFKTGSSLSVELSQESIESYKDKLINLDKEVYKEIPFECDARYTGEDNFCGCLRESTKLGEFKWNDESTLEKCQIPSSKGIGTPYFYQS